MRDRTLSSVILFLALAFFGAADAIANPAPVSRQITATEMVGPLLPEATVVAEFSWSPASPAVGQSVQFTDETTGSPSFWCWSFGDGGAGTTTQNPTHTFSTPGSYTVSLQASNGASGDIVTHTVAVTDGLVAEFSWSPTSPAVGQSVHFADETFGSATFWSWSFGDASGAGTQNPTHVFSTPGSYTVSLVTGNGTSTDSVSHTVTAVAGAFVAEFSWSPASPTVGQSVQFTDETAGSPTFWSWSFGDASGLGIQNPTHVFSTPGSYTVSLVTGNGTSTDSVSHTVTAVAGAFVAEFSWSPASPTVGQSVQFTDETAGSPTFWSWSFGDASGLGIQNPTHTFSAPGSYTVSLVTGNGTSADSVSHTVTAVAGAFVAEFSWSPASPTVGQSVQFTDETAGSPTFWSWSFGDASGLGIQNPTHTFSAPGSYTVSLVTGNGTSTDSVSHTVTAVAGAFVAEFSWSPASPTVGQSVQFTDETAGSPTFWSWSFGDASGLGIQNPTHTFNAAGSYTVSLVTGNGTSTDSVSHTVTAVAEAVVAEFSWSPTSPTVGQSVQFTDETTGSPTFWSWSFGDGSAMTAQNPTHAFSAAGSYTVSLHAANSTGSDSVSHTVTVADAVMAEFRWSPVSPTVGQSVLFIDESTGSPTSWAWSFGDGRVSSSRTPSHAFTAAGSYGVSLRAANGTSSDSLTHPVTVAEAVVAEFSWSPTSPTVGQSVQFTDETTGSPTFWSWSFGDGSAMTAQNPTHAFSAAASHTVVLQVANGASSDSASHVVTVEGPVVAEFSWSPMSPTAGQSVQFTDETNGMAGVLVVVVRRRHGRRRAEPSALVGKVRAPIP